MTELTLAKTNALTLSKRISPALMRRLQNAEQTWADASADLAANPGAVAELREAWPVIEAAMEPCGGHAVVQALAPLMALYGVPRKSEAEAKAFWGFYIQTLEEVPLQALNEAIADYVADARSEWFPKPGPLKDICDRRTIPLRMAFSRARKALELAQ
jgi:hypothetical protein